MGGEAFDVDGSAAEDHPAAAVGSASFFDDY